MRLAKSFRDILKPTSLGLCIFVSLSLTFVAGFVFTEHQLYLSSYQNFQKLESTVFQQKTTAILENLKKLSQLTNVRIGAAHGIIKRIENILSSVPLSFPDYEFPRIKDVAYHKLSHPQMTISRFGTRPLLSEHVPRNTPSPKETAILFDKDDITSKTPIFSEDGHLEGMLEIQMPLSAFKSSLGNFETFTFIPAFLSQKALQNNPLPIYAKMPVSFWEFLFFNMLRYAVFLFYLTFAVIFFAFFASYLRQRFEKASQNKVEMLETALSQSNNENETLQTTLLNERQTSLVQQRHHKSYQLSFKSYKKLHAHLMERQKEQVGCIVQTINSIKQSTTSLLSQLQEMDATEALDSFLQAIQLLPGDRISRMKNELIDLKKLMEEIQALFAERIYKYNILVEVTYPKNLIFKGDILYTKLILITLFSKSIYRLSQDEKILIKLEDYSGALRVDIQDNGYTLNNKENLRKKSLVFVIKDEIFDSMCKEQGLFYQYSKAKNGLNIARITIPALLPEGGGNVVPLFK